MVPKTDSVLALIAIYGQLGQLYIDPETCIDCGLCVDECPVQAIFPKDDLPAEWHKYIEINANWFKKEKI